MNRPRSKIGSFAALAYLSLVALSIAYIVYRIHFKPINSEFCGMPLLLLTMPWSLWLTQLLALLRYNFDLSVYLNILLSMLPGAALNAWLLYVVASKLEPKR